MFSFLLISYEYEGSKRDNQKASKHVMRRDDVKFLCDGSSFESFKKQLRRGGRQPLLPKERKDEI
tara:strand:- start:267 stop:461 length:195 start_codon:yes stop_codon:yes gene_type:complete